MSRDSWDESEILEPLPPQRPTCRCAASEDEVRVGLTTMHAMKPASRVISGWFDLEPYAVAYALLPLVLTRHPKGWQQFEHDLQGDPNLN